MPAKRITDSEMLDWFSVKGAMLLNPGESEWICLAVGKIEGRGVGPRSAILAAIKQARKGE